MATPNPYFLYPFCTDGGSGDLTSINNTGSDSGTVNYQYGFTPNYEYPSTDPNSYPVPRQQFNQLMLDITYAIQQVQTQGFPLWIASGSGGPANYPIYACVAYNSGSGINLYMSVVGSNTSTPGADNKWVVFSGNALGVQTGTIIDFAGVAAPSGYLICDGSPQPRSTYPNLMAAITQTQSCTTDSTTTVTVADSSNMFPGIPVEGVGIAATTVISSITNSTTIVISIAATASGTVDLTFFNWGNGDGSATFTLPNLKDTSTRGSEGTGAVNVIGNITGQYGGADTVTLVKSQIPNHTHNGTLSLYSPNVSSPQNQISTTYLNASPYVYSYTTGNITGYTSQSAVPVISNSVIVTKCIKT